jgi:hypothetical protein
MLWYGDCWGGGGGHIREWKLLVMMHMEFHNIISYSRGPSGAGGRCRAGVRLVVKVLTSLKQVHTVQL